MKNDPAFPSKNEIGYGESGLTKREYFAALAMQGVLTGTNCDGSADTMDDHKIFKNIAAASVACADALIEELEKK